MASADGVAVDIGGVPLSKGRNGTRYFYYACGRAGRTVGIDCKENYLQAKEADQYILDYVGNLALKHDVIKKLCVDQNEVFAQTLKRMQADRERVRAT